MAVDQVKWAAGCRDWQSKPTADRTKAEREAQRLNVHAACDQEHKVIEYHWRKGRGWVTVASHEVETP